MEVRIRLQKAGKSSKGSYNFRIVAINRTTGRQARNLEILGHYNPARQPAEVKIHQEKLAKWLENGASMSETVKSLVKNYKPEVAVE